VDDVAELDDRRELDELGVRVLACRLDRLAFGVVIVPGTMTTRGARERMRSSASAGWAIATPRKPASRTAPEQITPSLPPRPTINARPSVTTFAVTTCCNITGFALSRRFPPAEAAGVMPAGGWRD
jgi:hypothetical protein